MLGISACGMTAMQRWVAVVLYCYHYYITTQVAELYTVCGNIHCKRLYGSAKILIKDEVGGRIARWRDVYYASGRARPLSM